MEVSRWHNMTKEELDDEINAVNAIFMDSVTEIAPQIYNFTIPEHPALKVQVSFPEKYPEEKPNILQLLCTNMTKYNDLVYLESLCVDKLNEVYREGEVCMFELLSELEMALEKYNEDNVAEAMKKLAIETKPKEEPKRSPRPLKPEILPPTEDPLKGWFQSDPIHDRGSTFVGFARKVTSLEEAEYYLNLLTTDKKVSKSRHNMTAWRIKGDKNGVQYQDRDDDGESAAGSRLLHLLTMMEVWDVIVVVSRWFGGAHIGPDRFKHINSAARSAIINAGFEIKKKKH